MTNSDNELDTPSTLARASTSTSNPRSEPELQAAVVRWLGDQGLAVGGRVVCVAGEPDIMLADRSVIYECKALLTRKMIYQAIGQVLLYRQCLNPDARAVIVGLPTPDAYALQPLVEALGIELVIWGPGTGDRRSEDEVQRIPVKHDEQPSTPSHPPTPTLHWNVQSLAVSQGLTTIAALSRATSINRQSLHPIWHNQAANIAVDTLTRLARSLDADPGGWFRWKDGRLVWNIAAVAERQGLTKAELGFQAGLYPRSVDMYWNNIAKFVFLETLAKLAEVLMLELGELFCWSSDTGMPHGHSRVK